VTSQPPQAHKEHPFLIDYPLNRVIHCYPPGIIRWYCILRSQILRGQILAEIGQYIPNAGSVAELGCGFGLFSNTFALTHPHTHFYCVDLSKRRIARARSAAKRCGNRNVEFLCVDACEAADTLPPQRCIFMFDLLHHLPPENVMPLLDNCWQALEPGGVMVVKDVSDRPLPKMAFTWILDVLMTRGEIPHYLSPRHFLGLAQGLGAHVVAHRINDYLPYPHILYICTKQP